MISRVKTGIPGLDEILNGGIPRGSIVLLSGGVGAGKTIFGLQFIYKGATDYNEPGLFVTLEEDKSKIIENSKVFGWDFERLEKEKKAFIVKAELYKFDALKNLILDYITSMGIKRVVIDTITTLSLLFERPIELKKSIIDLGTLFKSKDCTGIVTSEIPEGSNKISLFGVEEFATDGVIVLHLIRSGNFVIRAIEVKKMRATDFLMKLHPMKINKKGIIVYPSEEFFKI